MHIPHIRTLATVPQTIIRRVRDGGIDQFLKDYDVPRKTLEKFGLTPEEAYLMHMYNPVHLYCRLKDIRMTKEQASKLAEGFRKTLYEGIVEFIRLRKQEQELNLEEITICFHHIFRREKPVGDGYGNCLICTPDTEKNPTCRGFYPFPSFQAKAAQPIQ